MMPVGMYRNHRSLRGIARHALLLSYGWNRGQSRADSQRCESYREFETHDFFLLFVSRNAPRRPKRQAISCAFGSSFAMPRGNEAKSSHIARPAFIGTLRQKVTENLGRSAGTALNG
jgi:hypothetical protein